MRNISFMWSFDGLTCLGITDTCTHVYVNALSMLREAFSRQVAESVCLSYYITLHPACSCTL